MYRLDTFARKENKLKYVLPWGRVKEYKLGSRKYTLVLNKDGGIQTTWKYRGPDLDSTVEAHLSISTMRLNSLFSSIGTGWTLYFEAQRSPSMKYLTTDDFPDEITRLIDIERKNLFSSGIHFESEFYITVYWRPPFDREEKMKELFIEGAKKKVIEAEDRMKTFVEQVEKIYSMFSTLNINMEYMGPDEIVTYLHSTISTQPRQIKVPSKPLLLDQYLPDEPFYGGLQPKLGSKHVRIIVPIVFASNTVFGMFNAFNALPFPFRWITRFHFLSKQACLSELDSIKRGWFGKMKSMMSMFKEVVLNQQENSENINTAAAIKFDEVKDAITAVESDATRYGLFSMAVIVMHDDEDEAETMAKQVSQLFADIGLKAKIEAINAVDAWMGCIPGAIGRNIRMPLISAGNLVHMMPLASIWAGPQKNKHLDGPPLIYTQTMGNTPFRLSLHVGDVGHALLVGPTGHGKSVHLNLITASFRKYRNAKVFIFDKGASAKILTYAVGGKFYDLGRASSELAFQPLSLVDQEDERSWATGWLCDFLEQENVTVNPSTQALIRDSLTMVADNPPHLRTITAFINNLQDPSLKEAFSPLAISDMHSNRGEYGAMFDADHDSLSFGSWQCFEMERLMNIKRIVGPTLMYIFHRIDRLLDATLTKKNDPAIIVLDECWVFLDNPIFANKIREWLKVLRKNNASVIFATQSLEDIVHSPIFDTVNQSCQSRIFLPDPTAFEEKRYAMYESFGLNRRQIEIIAKATPKRQYYYSSLEGCRLYDLALEACPLTLSYLGGSQADKILAEHIKSNTSTTDQFNTQWLAEHNISYPVDNTRKKISLTALHT